jgi:hypothetical protein
MQLKSKLILPVLVFFCTGTFFPTIQIAAQSTTSPTEKKSRREKKEDKQAKIDEMIRLEEEGTIVYPKQNIFGFHLYSDGWGAMFEKGKQKNANKATLFSLEFGERKHRKEVKLFDQSSGGGFIFGQPLLLGKENNFFFTKFGIGQSYLIGGKGNKNGVSVNAVYKGGLSLGMLKPYYVDIQDPTSGQIISVKYEGGDGKFDSEFLGNPLGSSGVFKGAGETQFKPGAFIKGALRFDYGRYNEVVSAIETGFTLEYYASTMPILINNEPKKTFVNVYVALQFGRRK